MGIGYACLTVGVPNTKQKGCLLKNYDPEVIQSIIKSNLKALENILDYNIKNKISLFRISSDIIPFGSHPQNTMKWDETFGDILQELGRKTLSNGLRLSMHPGQYTVLNSPDKRVVDRAVEDLRYHTQFLDALGLGQEHKIVLHIGGVYGDKSESILRFIQNYRFLDEKIKSRLVIENDDRQYTISDVLNIGKNEGIPVVYDNLHNQLNTDKALSDVECINLCAQTWKKKDGVQKIHYSQQNENKRTGAHSDTLDVEKFLSFYEGFKNYNIDIMVEVKDKNLSALKCLNAIVLHSNTIPKIKNLENEWAKYKYLVLEHSPKIYNEIRQLLNNKSVYNIVNFSKLIDEALITPIEPGNAVNAALHIWGYFKDSTESQLKQKFFSEVKKIEAGKSSLPIKRLLWKLVNDKQQKYLLDSLYFISIL